MFRVANGLDRHDLLVNALGEASILIKNESNSTRHAGRHVAPRGAKHHHHAACHVFTTVIAGTFHPRFTAAVAHGKALASPTKGIQLTAGGAIEAGVTKDLTHSLKELGSSVLSILMKIQKTGMDKGRKAAAKNAKEGEFMDINL